MALVAVVAAFAAGCTAWPTFRYGPAHTGYNPFETKLGVGNVAQLQTAWTATMPTSSGNPLASSPAVADGRVYITSTDRKLYVFGAGGTSNCSGTPKTCVPLWTAATGNDPYVSSPAVSNGVVYVLSTTTDTIARLYAFDANGTTNCGGTPKTCAPLWTGDMRGYGSGLSPTVVNGTVYVVDVNGLYAFDAAGTKSCTGTPKVCMPLWSDYTGAGVGFSSPAVANGVLYLGSYTNFDRLYAFDATGSGCTAPPPTCTPLWSAANLGSSGQTVAVANGVVYVGAGNSLFAVDASGSTNCGGTPKLCTPLWTATAPSAMNLASPAVANGAVYIGSEDGRVYAYDAAGEMNCSGTPKRCNPLWTATTGNSVYSSPAVANGVLYVASEDGNMYAYDAAGSMNCAGAPKVCAPLWSTATASAVYSSPAVVDGVLYVASGDGTLYAFSVPSPR